MKKYDISEAGRGTIPWTGAAPSTNQLAAAESAAIDPAKTEKNRRGHTRKKILKAHGRELIGEAETLLASDMQDEMNAAGFGVRPLAKGFTRRQDEDPAAAMQYDMDTSGFGR